MFFWSSVNDINLAIFVEMFFGQVFNIKKWKKKRKENLI
jgi:hypothetical protein